MTSLSFFLIYLSLCLDCLVLSVDAIDMSGKHEVDLHTNIWKVTSLEKKSSLPACVFFLKKIIQSLD